MSKLTQFLQKAGLVEQEDQASDPASLPVPPDDPSLPAPEAESREISGTSSGRAKFTIDGGDPAPDGDSADGSRYELAEGVAFDAIYRNAGLPEASFPIERLQKLVDGLRQLDPATQKAAVQAMDAADDSWSIEEVLADAQRKSDALHAYNTRTASLLATIEQGIEQDVASMTQAKDAAIAELRARVADLQQQLETATSQHASDIATLGARKVAAQQAAERERQRVNECINGMNNLIHPYLSSTSNR